MNQKRRRTLEQAMKLVAHAAGDLEKAADLAAQVKKEEKSYRSRLPRPLQNSSKAAEADEALQTSGSLLSAAQKALKVLPTEARSFAQADQAGDVLAQHLADSPKRNPREVLDEVADALRRQRPKGEVLKMIEASCLAN